MSRTETAGLSTAAGPGNTDEVSGLGDAITKDVDCVDALVGSRGRSLEGMPPDPSQEERLALKYRDETVREEARRCLEKGVPPPMPSTSMFHKEPVDPRSVQRMKGSSFG